MRGECVELFPLKQSGHPTEWPLTRNFAVRHQNTPSGLLQETPHGCFYVDPFKGVSKSRPQSLDLDLKVSTSKSRPQSLDLKVSTSIKVSSLGGDRTVIRLTYRR